MDGTDSNDANAPHTSPTVAAPIRAPVIVCLENKPSWYRLVWRPASSFSSSGIGFDIGPPQEI